MPAPAARAALDGSWPTTASSATTARATRATCCAGSSPSPTELTLAERVGLIRDVNALAEAGELPMADALALVPRFATDPSRQIVEATLRIASGVSEHLVPPDREPHYARFVSKMYRQRSRALGFPPKPGEDDETRLLRPALLAFVAREGQEPQLQAEARRLSLEWLTTARPSTRRWSTRCSRWPDGYGDRALFDRFRAAAKSEPAAPRSGPPLQRTRKLPGSGAAERSLRASSTRRVDYRETVYDVFLGHRARARPRSVWDFVKPNYDAMVATDAARDRPGSSPDMASGFCDAANRKDGAGLPQRAVDKLPGGPRNLAQMMEDDPPLHRLANGAGAEGAGVSGASTGRRPRRATGDDAAAHRRSARPDGGRAPAVTARDAPAPVTEWLPRPGDRERRRRAASDSAASG